MQMAMGATRGKWRMAAVIALTLGLLGGLPGVALAQSCALDGVKVADGKGHKFYSARSVPKGQTCESVMKRRKCEGGALTGSKQYKFDNCITLENFLGVNVNRRPDSLDPELIERADADWVRANVDILIYEKQDKTGKANPRWPYDAWDHFKAAAEGPDKKAILNLMWDFEKEDITPPAPGSDREAELFAYLDSKVLDNLAQYADIIVTGNEPFVNTSEKDWKKDKATGIIPMVAFYERVADHVNTYLIDKGLREQVDLYMGAYTRLHTKKMQDQPAVKALLRFSEATPYIDGVDLHAHVTNLKQIEKLLQFTRSYTSKPLLVTEFTFVWRMKTGLQDDKLGQAFGAQWGYDPNMPTIDYITCYVYGMTPGCKKEKYASKDEWDSFLSTRDWWLNDFIPEAHALFVKYGVRGSTFGLTLAEDGPTKKQLGLDRPPWYLGGLFSPAAIEPLPDGEPQPNYQFLDDFLKVQHAN